MRKIIPEYPIRRLDDDHATVRVFDREYVLLQRAPSADGPAITEFIEDSYEDCSALLVSDGLNLRLRPWGDRRGTWLVARDAGRGSRPGHHAERLGVHPQQLTECIRPGRRLGRALDAAQATPMPEQLRACGLRQVCATPDGLFEFHAGEVLGPRWIIRHDVAKGWARPMYSRGVLEEWIDQPPFTYSSTPPGELPSMHGPVFRGSLDEVLVAHKGRGCGERPAKDHYHCLDGRTIASHVMNHSAYVEYVGTGSDSAGD